MHDELSLLTGTFRDSLYELRYHYEHLNGLSTTERNRIVSEANELLESTKAAILHEDTTSAKQSLLRFQYFTRLGFDLCGFDARGNPEDRSRRYFVEQLSSLFTKQKPSIEAWRWRTPSLSEFSALVWPNLSGVDFYTQASLLCNQIYGLPIPSKNDITIASWAKRACLTEESWAWRYENQIKDERARWFPSKKRIRAIEHCRELHRAQTMGCLKELEPIFLALAPAMERIETLKSQELKLSVQCNSINRAANAIAQGIQLKHLLLEEGYEMDKIFRAVTRGL